MSPPTLGYSWNFREAREEIRMASAVDPNSAYAHEVSCWIEEVQRRMPEAIAECRRAVDLDPVSLLNNWGLGSAYYFARDYEHAIEQANKTLEIDPRYSDAVELRGLAYEQIGNYKQAMEHWITSERLLGKETRATELRQVFETSGYPGFLKNDAKAFEREGHYYSAAADYAMLGEKDVAFGTLEKAFALRARIVQISVDPRFDKIRSDPRYADLLRRIGLPQ